MAKKEGRKISLHWGFTLLIKFSVIRTGFIMMLRLQTRWWVRSYLRRQRTRGDDGWAGIIQVKHPPTWSRLADAIQSAGATVSSRCVVFSHVAGVRKSAAPPVRQEVTWRRCRGISASQVVDPSLISASISAIQTPLEYQQLSTSDFAVMDQILFYCLGKCIAK